MNGRNSAPGIDWDDGTWGGATVDRRALDALFTATYEELRRLAATRYAGPRPIARVHDKGRALTDAP